MKTVNPVAQNDLCTGCGTCEGVCPTGAIEMRVSSSCGIYLPAINEEECVECGLCVKCCPGYSVDSRRFGVEASSIHLRDAMLGNYLGCYVGYSKDPRIMRDASSGGIATQLLVYALEKGIIDGALVVRMKADNSLEPESFIARTKDDLLFAARSKYCPVPLNVALKQIVAEDGRFAVVGLPCHIHGIRLAEKFRRGLKDKIVLRVGLLCGRTVNFEGTQFILDRLGIDRRSVTSLHYRGNGWPGSMTISLRDESEFRIEFNKGWNAYWNIFSPFLFTPVRCMKCPDQSNEFSDISLGDAWLKEFADSQIGESVVITRTDFAEKLLYEMNSDSVISIRRISADKVKESQGFSLNFKKEVISGRLSLFRILGESVPVIYPEPASSFLGAVGAILPFLSRFVSSSKRLRPFLRSVPMPLFRVYFGFFKVFFFLSSRYRVW